MYGYVSNGEVVSDRDVASDGDVVWYNDVGDGNLIFIHLKTYVAFLKV